MLNKPTQEERDRIERAFAARDFDVKPSPCPHCGHQCDAAYCTDTQHEARPPQPGDVTLCFDCGSVLVFGEGLVLRSITDADWATMDIESMGGIKKWQSMWKKYRPKC